MDLFEPATRLLDRLRRRELSSRELVGAMLDRIGRLNPALNAIVTLDPEGALAAAAEADRRLGAGEGRPLEGLPMTVKDSFDTVGLPSTAGSPGYRDRRPDSDATAVARLRQAGAIILGKSCVPVFTGDFQSYNPIHGVANNPWDPSRSPGGSSGGAAAAVASGMSPVELGSDLGGSVRWPAHACGVFGLKPTWNRVSTFGHVPPPPERRFPKNADLVVAGPIARSAIDLDLLLPILSGPPPATPRVGSAQGLRVALWLDDPFGPVQRDVVEAVRKAAALLAEAGAEIDERARPGLRFEEAFEVFALLNHAIVAYGLPPKVRDRMQRAASAFAPGDLSHRALQARGARMTPSLYQEVQSRRQALKRRWARFFETVDVLLCPPATVMAMRS
jgi:amidase